ncbi:inactive dipeptidyl peptidase 10-like isoform X2 [Ruditapes philippinarum]|uniref:inactive dipeptidyl peptidase 10-like isoform X2 n=1 Tax=Ruditapes philippinarum TaxID=129788 RepID=UPI00295BCC8E|nr:inactive dipeptidyl peptidase 10-like isoform X2 [Ruditapes philippinarum]
MHSAGYRFAGSRRGPKLRELVGSTTEQRNWRGILIALLVIVTVFGLIIAAIVLITPKELDENFGEKLTFKELVQHKFDPLPFQKSWTSGETLIYRRTDGMVVQFDCGNNETSEIMDNSTFRELDTEKYKVSPDGKYVLLPYNIQNIYRYTYLAKYRIYDTEKKFHIDLIGPIINGKAVENDFQYVAWSPTDHGLIVVANNNIYYLKPWNSLKEIESSDYSEVTSNGLKDVIYNGVPDWLYEEEILLSDHAIWWNPDASGIVYASIDNRHVQTYDMTIYGPLKNRYVENRRLPYPRPGTTNPTVTMKYYNFNNKSSITFKPPTDFVNTEYYVTSVTWKDSTHVLVTWLNRPQNVSILTICDIVTYDCSVSFRVEAENGWLDMSQSAVFSSTGDEYFIILSQKEGEHGSFKHIAKIDASTSNRGTRLFVTSGRLEVKKILAYHDVTNTVYFLGVQQDDPRERHLYSATAIQESEDFRQPTCLSCDYSDECLFVDATFSPKADYFVLSCKGPGVPYYQLMTPPFNLVKMLEDNEQLRENIKGKGLPKIEFAQITADDGHDIWVKLFLPAVLKKDEIITFNMVMKVYGSPGTQMVTHEYSVDWEHYECSAHGLIIVYVDTRGSGGRGDDWTFSIYKNLGTLEVEDTITVAKHFLSQQYVHAQAAIIGISHGGFVAASVLGNRDNPFSAGIAVAPVTDWRYYDSFYTEKFMGFPTGADNIQGYNTANVSGNAGNFRKSKFMLIHGTGDDNVHFQHSAQLIRALTESDVYFKTQIYTDQQHWLNGGNTRNHLYNTMEDFLFRSFGRTPPREVPEVVIVEEEED